jgi:MazG family protein
LYIPGATHISASRYSLDPLVEVMEKLRGEDGCPWDQEQDHISLRRYCLEEACEVIAAIDSGDTSAVVDELGDLLLQIAFHAQIGFEEGEYDLNDIVGAICAKMIRRHPHVFGNAAAENSEEVLLLWEQIKQQERGDELRPLLHGVGKGLPALMRARKIQEKASSVGFDWPDASGAIAKVREELEELLEAAQQADLRAMEMELGDLLFSVVNWSRFLGIDPELALNGSSDKFTSRFSKMEKESALLGKNLITMTLSELDVAWDSIKQHKD